MNMIDLNDTRIAYEAKSNKDLKRAKVLFRSMGSPALLSLGRFGVNIATTLKIPIGWTIKPTIYKQFVAGETLAETVPALEALYARGVLSVLDYSAEGGHEASEIRATQEEIIRSIDFAADHKHIAFTVFKPSALIRTDLLEKVSMKKGDLTSDEINEYELFRKTFLDLCGRSAAISVPILIDAEYYAWQDAIDRITEEAMLLYNQSEPIVYATLQMYRHDRMPYLQDLDERAQQQGFKPGIKFVRGAYMEDERKRANEGGYPDPICPDKKATDENFDAGLKYVIERIDRFGLFLGTHNETSNLLLMQLIDAAKIDRQDKRIIFAQLYGMSDNITFNLSSAGYRASKYVPYAPVNKVLPYLIRRAEENTSIAQQKARELWLIDKEIERRKQESR